MNKGIAWFNFAKRVWVALGLGWVSLIILLTPYLRLDRAGAILVCAAIIAEVFHEKGHRRFLKQIAPGVYNHYLYLEIDVPGENRKDIQITAQQARIGGPTTVNTERWSLYHLSKPEDFLPHGATRMWLHEKTMTRAERRLEFAIVITAIVGTVLWAYG